MAQGPEQLTAVILAGERPGRGALAEAGGVSCKALLKVGGRAMVERVIDALSTSARVGRILLCGPGEAALADPALAALLRRERVGWVAPAATPAASVVAALAHLGQRGQRGPVLVTTADHALLAPVVVDHFLELAAARPAILVAGVARRERVRESFPELRKTTLLLKDGGFCGCNLFLMKTPEARRGAEFWREVESHRKRPWRMASLIGWGFLVRYLSGRLTLAEAMSGIGNRMGITVDAVELPFAEAAVDVDSVDDWRVIETALKRGRAEAPGTEVRASP